MAANNVIITKTENGKYNMKIQENLSKEMSQKLGRAPEVFWQETEHETYQDAIATALGFIEDIYEDLQNPTPKRIIIQI